ncbi:uncharacterized protein CIMG_05471 [Coccidioides immitis RS]|uniref:LYR motif-containing protein Cup1-like N-terminal domain-containing protein n=2 Tax=Coccidioides immitis TaxID=5501 RepID=A0A0E1RZC6_COCIM|nr:uncharacterized protein CIMG_05471 [Coccidioides immitis RS]EAS34447.1 hypothetical protein CIMG_05471 [Coccidioides immitis RS]KMU91166.1 hypothetical protein CIHG_08915 [Coccidioides immitis H538.4]TPX21884.1 hypothetical protein DIZ76_015849 [Coccidioides immitis]
MAVPSVLATRSTPWRHLYRSLLRECTYLPDPIASGYMHNYIRSGFRESVSEHKIRGLKPIQKLHRHRRFRKLLSLLHRANQGYLKSLQRVLFLSYGRIGKRRNFLMRPLLGDQKKIETYDDDWEPPSALLTLVRDQSRRKAVSELKLRRNVKVFEPPIPKTNSWGRPTPFKRRVNIRRKWHQSLMNSVLPMLPEQEWEVLQGLASGKAPWSAPKRRKTPASHQQDTLLTPEFIVYGPPKGPTFATYLKGRPHNITRKFMENIWKKVCTLTPKMTWDETNDKWSITWGLLDVPRRHPSRKLDPEKGATLFQGIDPRTGLIERQKPNKAKI